MEAPWASSSSASLGGTDDTMTLIDESTFCISDHSGDVRSGHPEGLFVRDTRFVSELSLRVNGRPPEPLAASSIDPFSGTFVLRDHPAEGHADSPLLVLRHRYVGQGMREDVVVRNFGTQPAVCRVELAVGCDFADLFEVKAERVEKTSASARRHEPDCFVFAYDRDGFRRSTRVQLSMPATIAGDVATYEIEVPPRGEWSTCLQFTAVFDEVALRPRYLCGRPVEHATPARRLSDWEHRRPTITVEHDPFARLLERSTEDLAALRIFDPVHPNRAVVAAGAPWFMTLFGRDSLLTSWMAMIVDPELALGTLQTLASLQGRAVTPSTEEEPGRILHEVRFGETARLSLGDSNIYYGTVDATPLFVMLLGELARWGTHPAEVEALLPAADHALHWIEQYGDRDGDGYVEYQRAGPQGLENQGWKDSWDSIQFANGELARAPIALCEVQAYTYAALRARAHIAREMGDTTRADELDRRAGDLKVAFNRDFWVEELGWYAMALDRGKRPVDALTSNMGHCLWTGIVDPERAKLVGARLGSDEMFSGWGIRTLATSMSGFNPLSYHNGSVWPHDNAIAVAGLMRYGLVDVAHRVTKGLIDTAAFTDRRLPELFGGVARSDVPFPVRYPTSCSPQAWAAAAPLLVLRSLLRFEPDFANAQVHLAPSVPDWMGKVRLERVQVMGGRLSIEAEGDSLRVVQSPDGLSVLQAPRDATL
ncbi:MAG: amylo-alpha-1,6-glucosidase [Acidimicrobiia bacterium]